MSSRLLLGGGADSIALCYALRPTVAVTIDYGQLPARAEIEASAEVCRALGISHEVRRADLSAFAAGSLSPRKSNERLERRTPSPEWWPYRNQLLITFAATVCIESEIDEVVIGTVVTDVTHGDGQPTFVEAMRAVLQCQEGRIGLQAPAIHLSSIELIRESRIPEPLLRWAHSCHKSNDACGQCRGCYKLREMWRELEKDHC